MIELRRKRNLFYQSIKMQKRQAYKAEIRKKLISQHKRQQVIQELDKAFWFLNGTEKKEFWVKQFIPNRRNYRSVYELMDSVCQKVKLVMYQHERDDQIRMEIRQYLFENMPFLIPPSHFELPQLPISFVDLCIYMLREVQFITEEKEDFVERLPYETINKCLLNYFVDNWAEISQNKCSDMMMTFFTEITQFRNIFKRYMYNDIKFEFLLNIIIQEIFNLTKVQRSIYEIFDSQNARQIDDLFSNNSFYGQLQSYNFRTKNNLNENTQVIILNKTMFLCNLLLMSPIPNYNMKQTKQKLKTILNYLYRKIFLKQNSQVSPPQIQFCLSVLISKTLDTNSYNQISMIEAVIKSGINRYHQQKSLFCNKSQPNQSSILEKEQDHTKSISYQQSIDVNGLNFQNFLNKVKLMMLYEASQELQHLRFNHIQKWLNLQIYGKKNNVLSIQNPDLMACFLTLLTNILKNHSNQKYNSYDSNRNRISNRSQDYLLAKIEICKLIGKKGFDQLFQHENLKFYCQELLQLLIALLQGLEQCGDILSSIQVLFFNSEILCQNSMKQNRYQNNYQTYNQMQNESVFFMNSFKSHIYSLSLKFLQRSFKFLGYGKKEKILLNLILVNYLTFEDCKKYLTYEEQYKFRRNAFSEEDYFENDECLEEQGYESQQEFSNNNEEIYFEGQVDKHKTWNASQFELQNTYQSKYYATKPNYENHQDLNKNNQQYKLGSYFSQSYQSFQPQSSNDQQQIEI